MYDMEIDLVKRIAAYDSSNGGHSDAAGGSAYDLLRECSDELIALRTALSALGGWNEAIEAAMGAMCSYCREGIPYDEKAMRHREDMHGIGHDLLYQCGAFPIRALRRPATGEGAQPRKAGE